MRSVFLLVMAAGSIGCASTQSTRPDSAGNGRYRIVRFHVKPGQETEFERFFRESLLPATERLAESPEAFRRELDAFTLLRPVNNASDGRRTYYAIYHFQGSQGPTQGEVLRNIVRRGFPGAEGEQRIRRWMDTLDLESLIPQGQLFERVIVDSRSGS